MTFLKYILPVLLISGILSPASALAFDDFGPLVVAEDMTPAERIEKKLELTKNALAKAIERAEGMRVSLGSLEFEEGSVELMLTEKYLGEVEGYLAFYNERAELIEGLDNLEDINAFIQTIITYREETYAPSAKESLEFILVFSYSPSVLETAKERLISIQSDVDRLESLELIEVGKFTEVLETSQITLNEIEGMQLEAKSLIVSEYATTTPLVESVEEVVEEAPAEILDELTEEAPTVTGEIQLTARELAEESLNKIKLLYDVFIETGSQVKEMLGI